jgi:Mg2+-importing ATPase
VSARAASGEAELARFWSVEPAELFAALGSSPDGLAQDDASRRRSGRARPADRDHARWRVLARQFANPLIGLLLFAAGLSALTGAFLDAAMVASIVVVSAGIGYRREHVAQAMAAALRRRLVSKAVVRRDGHEVEIPSGEVVAGDVVVLAAGDLVPGDGVLLETSHLHVSEALLTGESFPVAKRVGTSPVATPLAGRTGCVFLGTHVVSGDGTALVVATGERTGYGAIARRLATHPPAAAFERGLVRFGELLTVAMLAIVIAVFVAHVVRGRPAVETLLFSIALAVGLSPELLPAILAVCLGRGAERMGQRGVLVRRLAAIENLGSMDVLCSDKTGTLTEGVVRLEAALDAHGRDAPRVLALATLNATLAGGPHNPLDEAIAAAGAPLEPAPRRLAVIPFDFVRKRTSVVVADDAAARLVTKGAFHAVLELCDTVDGAPLGDRERAELAARHDAWSARGLRVLALASRTLAPAARYEREDERAMTFEGFLTFLDPPKPGVERAIAALGGLGVAIKLISGDGAPVCRHLAAQVGIDASALLTGAELDRLSDEALLHQVEHTTLFAEVDPNQKERIILALRKRGHIVGFLGDGINDAPAMHAADVSISVEHAVEVAREAADLVLLAQDLESIRAGIEEGRRTFVNTLKYLRITTSANLGNMMSMAAASFFVPFLPLLPGQILLNNLLSDIPAVGLADDAIDPELVARPRSWQLGPLARELIAFGALSSLFDLATFAILLGWFDADEARFRSAWFVESLLTELVIALVVRTERPLLRSRPGRLFASSTALLIAIAIAIPFVPLAGRLGFTPLPGAVLGAVLAITALYALTAEVVKRRIVVRREPARSPERVGQRVLGSS